MDLMQIEGICKTISEKWQIYDHITGIEFSIK